MQKAKKEDFRIEEELRSQKAKYEEANEDVYRRMEDIREAEIDSVADLTAFLDAELAYYDSCREILLQLKREWPAASVANGRKPNRSRSNTTPSHAERFEPVEEEPAPKIVPKIASRTDSPARSLYHRSVTTDDSIPQARDFSPSNPNRLSRVSIEPAAMLARAALRPLNRAADVADEDSSSVYSSGRSDSPTTSYGRIPSRTTSWSTDASTGAKKAPPPPPPSRSKKPPPPPPMKRSSLSMSEVPHLPH
jgi:BAR domain